MAGAHIGYFGHYLLDNIYLFAFQKIINKNPDSFYKGAQKFWLFALVCYIIKNYRKTKYTNYLIAQLQAKKLNYEPQEFDELQSKLDLKRRKATIFMIKDCLDLIVAFKMSGTAALFGINISEGVIGLMGASSGLICLHHLYNLKKQ